MGGSACPFFGQSRSVLNGGGLTLPAGWWYEYDLGLYNVVLFFPQEMQTGTLPTDRDFEFHWLGGSRVGPDWSAWQDSTTLVMRFNTGTLSSPPGTLDFLKISDCLRTVSGQSYDSWTGLALTLGAP